MAYRLKKGEENFEIVDGPDAGKKFERGKVYAERPYVLRGRFEEIPEETPPATAESEA